MFENNTGDSSLSEVVDSGFERALTAAPGLSRVAPDRIATALTLMRRPRTTPLDAAIAREVVLRDGGAVAAITGRIDKVGNDLIVSAEIAPPNEAGMALSIVEPAAPRNRLDETIRREAAHIRQAITANAAAFSIPRQNLRKVTSPSLRAVELYSQAAALLPDGVDHPAVTTHDPRADNALAQTLLESALREDPDFGAAHTLLAYAIRNQQPCTGCPAERIALAHAERATELALDVSSVERHWILATGHDFRVRFGIAAEELIPELRNAIEEWAAVIRDSPDFPVALDHLLSDSSAAVVLRAQAAARLAELADTYPDTFRVNVAAAIAARDAEDEPAVDRLSARAERLMTARQQEANLGWSSELDLLLMERAWLRDDPHDVRHRLTAMFAQVDGGRPGLAALINPRAFNADLALGRLRDAEVCLGRYPPGTQHDVTFLWLLKERRDINDLRAFLAPRMGGVASVAIGIEWAEAGFLDEARRIVRLEANRGGRSNAYRLQIQEAIDLAEHRPEDAVRVADRVLPGLPFGGRHLQMSMITASAFEQLGRTADAIRTLEVSTAHRMAVADDRMVVWLDARAQLADLYHQIGREQEARAVEDHLLRLLSEADPDYPLLVELRTRSRARSSN
jgi:hypothetical protein